MESPAAFAGEDDVDGIKEDSQVKQERHILDMDKAHNAIG
jgi:hypothetical protein